MTVKVIDNVRVVKRGRQMGGFALLGTALGLYIDVDKVGFEKGDVTRDSVNK